MTLTPRGFLEEHTLRSLDQARAEKQRNGSQLRLITGDEFPLLLNVYRHANAKGHSYDEYSGQYARASAHEDATSWSRNTAGMNYEMTLRLNPDGTFDVVDLS